MVCADVVTTAAWPPLLAAWPGDTEVLTSLYAGGSPDSSLVAAWDGDQPLGYGVLQWRGPVSPAARADYPDAVELNHLWVHDGARGRGAGTAIVRAASREAARRGRSLLLVGVGDDNDGARRLYERLGFVATGVRDTTRYTYRADDGTRREAVETDEAMVLELSGRAGTPGEEGDSP